MNFVLPDVIKNAILNVNRYIGTLERRGIITYQDKITLRGPLYRQSILFEQAGNDLLGEMIGLEHPFMVCRMGAVELSCLRHFLEKRQQRDQTYSRKICRTMAHNAGFFPINDHELDAFCEIYLASVSHTDIMAVWFNKNEHVICNNYCPDAQLIDLTCLEPFWYTDPWSSRLAGRKVLVVHPFADSITKQ